MNIIKAEIRSGAYFDSVILMQLQRSLAALPGVIDAGVVMGTDANKDILSHANLLPPESQNAKADDLVIVVQAKNETDALAALDQVDDLLFNRRDRIEHDYHPKSLDSAIDMIPDAQWVLVSVPGRYAAGVARQALDLDKNVFLYSDNVSLEDEVELKQLAIKKRRLVMGPDCGTAIINGVGLGFANKVRRGSIGMVAASGTGLQQVSSLIHQLGSGITHAIGTGGRDLSEEVNAVTFLQGLELLRSDAETKVIVLVSKPPSKMVVEKLITTARLSGKPVVVDFIGYATPVRQIENIYFTTTFDETAELAVQLASAEQHLKSEAELPLDRFVSQQSYLRGLFSGGTLAYEAMLILNNYLPEIYSNVPLKKEFRLADSLVSQRHTIIDLGEDEFTVGRLHPMMDNDLRLRQLQNEAEDPETAVILLDVVLGYGAHPNPAGEIAPAIIKAYKTAEKAGRYLEVVVVVVGTEEDPQGLESQIDQLKQAGARVETSNSSAAGYVGRLLSTLNSHSAENDQPLTASVDLEVLNQPLAAINVGLESFTSSLKSQDAEAVQVDWRPPAGGNEKLMGILERMKTK